jgi:hypothetical protein
MPQNMHDLKMLVHQVIRKCCVWNERSIIVLLTRGAHIEIGQVTKLRVLVYGLQIYLLCMA